MSDSQDPREALEVLVEHFGRNLNALKSSQYNEAQARQEFINPFFTLLGWDMDNRNRYAEAYKDVIHEDAIKVGGYTKAPDYCFRIGGTRKFFVEAKKPSVNIKDDPSPAYQLRRYAWSAKLPLSILTDFEELAVFDCRLKPSQTDKSSAGRVQFLTYRDYVKEWDSIASVFSREAVLKGSFDKYVESNRAKRGTAEVDAAFLKEIEAWRDTLARNLALRNPGLTTRELNFAVQATLDRLIFLRICEDRGVEDYGRLLALQNGPDVYSRLVELFRAADDRYNSGLFHFGPEKGRPETPDTLTPGLAVDDKVLKDILKTLYYPESPYEFSVLPADILGQVYEQFLGKVIRLTAGHQAKVEDKPEVKKAGGVYYTPTYIVDYIVQNTVGKILGSRVKGQVERVTDGDQELSGVGGLAEINGLGGGDLSPRKDVPEGGDLRADKPDQESSCVRSGEHRGGIREDSQGGLHSSPLDGARFSHGSGNASRHSIAAEVSSAGVRKISAGPPPRGGKDAHAPDSRSSKPSTLSPLPLTLRILDPACGSGSFLLGAYQYLLTWYRDQYVADGAEKWAKKKEPKLYQAQHGEWKLTTAERKRILLDHIYGVDIDSQAVEVTKLSLLLKVLEGETKESVAVQRRLFHERALPDLARNIKCGNSLIGSDFYKGRQIDLFDEEERARINAFDWEVEFPEVFSSPKGKEERDIHHRDTESTEEEEHFTAKGAKEEKDAKEEKGFDVVIGNPPYVRQESLSNIKDYLQSHYESFNSSADLYVFFVERAMTLLRDKGLFSIIVSSSFLRAAYGEGLRHFLRKNLAVRRIVDFGGLAVFENAKDTYVCIPLLEKSASKEPTEICKVPALNMPDFNTFVAAHCFSIPHERLSDEAWALKSDEDAAVFRKIQKAGTRLGEYLKGKMFYGLKSGLNEAFELDLDQVCSIKQLSPSNSTLVRQYLGGQDIRRYSIRDQKRFMIVIPSGWTRKQMALGGGKSSYPSEREAWKWLNLNYEGIANHLATFSDALMARQDKGEYWWEFRACDYYEVLASPKIIFPDICKNPRFFLDHAGLYLTNTAYCLGTDSRYLLGILNSRLFWFAISNISIPFGVRAGEYRYRLIYQYMEKVPIRVLDLSDEHDAIRHAQMVSLVDRMLDLQKRLPLAKTDHEKTLVERQIAATDKEIDALVYELYGLTQDEIAIVEGMAEGR